MDTLPRLSLFAIEAELLGLIEAREDALERMSQYAGQEDTYHTECDEIQGELETIDGLIRQYVKAEVKKVDSVAAAIKQYETMAEVHLKESDRLKKLAEREQETADRIREMVITVMDEFGEKKLQGSMNTLAVRGNSGVQPLTITQPDLVPLDLKRLYVEISAKDEATVWNLLCEKHIPFLMGEANPHNALIRERLQRGEGVPGCRLEERGVHLRVL